MFLHIDSVSLFHEIKYKKYMFYMLRKLMKLLLNFLLRKVVRPGALGLCQVVAKSIVALRTCLFYQQVSS